VLESTGREQALPVAGLSLIPPVCVRTDSVLPSLEEARRTAPPVRRGVKHWLLHTVQFSRCERRRSTHRSVADAAQGGVRADR